MSCSNKVYRREIQYLLRMQMKAVLFALSNGNDLNITFPDVLVAIQGVSTESLKEEYASDTAPRSVAMQGVPTKSSKEEYVSDTVLRGRNVTIQGVPTKSSKEEYASDMALRRSNVAMQGVPTNQAIKGEVCILDTVLSATLTIHLQT